jgi:hypothetical protein
LADAGYVTSRHGAGTHVADRPPQKRGAEALAGIVAEMLRRGAEAGFTPDEVASAAFAAATERKRPGALVQVLFAECTNADAGYDAERLSVAFEGRVQVEGTLLDDLPDRLDRFHYDLVATTTFHADEAQALVHGPAGRDARRARLRSSSTRSRLPADRASGSCARRAGQGEHGRDPRPVRHPVELLRRAMDADADLNPSTDGGRDPARGGHRERLMEHSTARSRSASGREFDPSGLGCCAGRSSMPLRRAVRRRYRSGRDILFRCELRVGRTSGSRVIPTWVPTASWSSTERPRPAPRRTAQ